MENKNKVAKKNGNNIPSRQSANQIRKYVWLLRKLYQYPKGLTRTEINEMWEVEAREYEGTFEISRSALTAWRDAIQELFGIFIVNENRGSYRYYILNSDDLKKDDIRKFILETASVKDMLLNMKDRILVDDKEDENLFILDKLELILVAMDSKKVVHIYYQSFWKDEPEDFDFEPYWLELSEQRWYVIGKRIDEGRIVHYGIDRIDDLVIEKDKFFSLPTDEDGIPLKPQKHYAERSGLGTDGEKMVKVRLYVEGNQQKYIRTLPLDPSQEEVEQTDEYSIFEYHLPSITYDFMKKILSYSPYVIVKEPKSLVDEIAWRAEALWKRYNG